MARSRTLCESRHLPLVSLAQALPQKESSSECQSMRIQVTGDDSISRQARTYAEYRLFAALSQVVDTSRVRSASLVLRRARSRRHCEGVVCTVAVEMNDGAVARLRAGGAHPYAAINRAVDRLRLNARPGQADSSHREMVAAE